MLWKLETSDLTLLNSLNSVSASALFWHVSWTTLHLSIPASFGASLLLLQNTLSKCMQHPYFEVLLNARHLQDVYHSICIFFGIVFIFCVQLVSSHILHSLSFPVITFLCCVTHIAFALCTSTLYLQRNIQ